MSRFTSKVKALLIFVLSVIVLAGGYIYYSSQNKFGLSRVESVVVTPIATSTNVVADYLYKNNLVLGSNAKIIDANMSSVANAPGTQTLRSLAFTTDTTSEELIRRYKVFLPTKGYTIHTERVMGSTTEITAFSQSDTLTVYIAPDKAAQQKVIILLGENN